MTRSGYKHYLVLIARQLLDNFSEIGYVLPGASKSWLSWNLQILIGEKEFSFGPRKTALKRRLQLSELAIVLLLKAECFYKLVFGPCFLSVSRKGWYEMELLMWSYDQWFTDIFCCSGVSSRGTAKWACRESYLLLCSDCSGQFYSNKWFYYPFHAAALGSWRAEGRPWSSSQAQDNTTTDSYLEGYNFDSFNFPESLFLRVGLRPSYDWFLIFKEYYNLRGGTFWSRLSSCLI